MENTTEDVLNLNLYSFPSRKNRAFIVDPIAGDAIMDISCLGYGARKFTSRKTQQPQQQSAVISLTHPSIPLTSVRSAYELNEHFVHSTLRCPSYERFRVNCTEQMDWLQKKYHSTLFKGLLRTVKDDRDLCPTVKRHIKNCLDDIDIYQNIGSHNPVFKKLYKTNNDKPKRSASLVSRYLTDIPKWLLSELLNESCFQDFDDCNTNWNARNCMVTVEQDGQTFVVCACGLEICLLKLMHLGNSWSGEDESVVGTYAKDSVVETYADEHLGSSATESLLSYEECGKIEVGFCVNELIHVDGGVILARMDYACVFVTIDCVSGSLQLTSEVRFDKLVMGAAMNPLQTDQFLVVAGDSSVVLVQDGHLVRNIKTGDADRSLRWQSILYGNFSQTSLVSNQHHVTFYDFREPVVKEKTYFDLPTEYLNRYDQISPVLCQNPINGHQYFFSTNQTVVMSDERYLKTPVMAINHYMRSPPRFQQVMHTTAKANNLLLTLGSYEDGEIVGLNFALDNSLEEVTLSDKLKIPCRKQASLDGPLMKFCKYNGWTRYMSDWRATTKHVTQRLSCPLIGISLCSGEDDRSILLQETQAGDIFFQTFKYQIDHEARASNKPHFCTDEDKLVEFTLRYKERCESWLHDCVSVQCNNKNRPCGKDIRNSEKVLHIETKHFENNLFETLRCDSNQENWSVSRDKTTSRDHSRLHIDEEQAMVSDDETRGLTSQEENQSNIGFNENYWLSMETMKLENKIITRASIGCAPVTRQSHLIVNLEKYRKPLSKTLYANWNSDDYVALETFAPYLSLTS